MSDIFSYGAMAQAIGFIAAAVIIYSFSLKSDARLRLHLAIGCFIFAIHLFLLEAYTGAAVAILSAMRAFLSIKFHNSNLLMLGFMSAYLIVGITLFAGTVSILPVIASISATYSLYKLSGKKFRIVSLFNSFIRLTYCTLVFSLGGIITELFIEFLNIKEIMRLKKEEKRRKYYETHR